MGVGFKNTYTASGKMKYFQGCSKTFWMDI